MTDEQLIEAAKIMVGKGDICLFWGMMEAIFPEDIPLAVSDPQTMQLVVAARREGVSVDVYKKYESHDWVCRANTKKGRRCRNPVVGIEYPKSEHFDPGLPENNLCECHLGYR